MNAVQMDCIFVYTVRDCALNCNSLTNSSHKRNEALELSEIYVVHDLHTMFSIIIVQRYSFAQ